MGKDWCTLQILRSTRSGSPNLSITSTTTVSGSSYRISTGSSATPSVRGLHYTHSHYRVKISMITIFTEILTVQTNVTGFYSIYITISTYSFMFLKRKTLKAITAHMDGPQVPPLKPRVPHRAFHHTSLQITGTCVISKNLFIYLHNVLFLFLLFLSVLSYTSYTAAFDFFCDWRHDYNLNLFKEI